MSYTCILDVSFLANVINLVSVTTQIQLYKEWDRGWRDRDTSIISCYAHLLSSKEGLHRLHWVPRPVIMGGVQYLIFT